MKTSPLINWKTKKSTLLRFGTSNEILETDGGFDDDDVIEGA